jgi:hypothetical protein
MLLMLGGAAHNVFVVSHESKKIAQTLPPSHNLKMKQDDGKTNINKVPNPLNPPPHSSPLYPINCLILTKESLIKPMQGHKEMGGDALALAKSGLRSPPNRS